MNAPVEVDWRKPHMQAVIEAFPGLDQYAIRSALALAMARPLTPGEAAAAVSEAAKGLSLTPIQRMEVTAIVAGLEKQAVMESEI